jgi:hypothetical protein
MSVLVNVVVHDYQNKREGCNTYSQKTQDYYFCLWLYTLYDDTKGIVMVPYLYYMCYDSLGKMPVRCTG